MTATAHALVGGAIAASVQDPLLGITLATLSHPILDMVPHWDAGWGWRQKTKQRLFLEGSFDLALGYLSAYLLFGMHTNFWYWFWCVSLSIAWDVAEIPYWFWRWDFPPFNWMYKFQSHIQGKAKLPWGLVNQVVAVGLIVFVLNRIAI